MLSYSISQTLSPVPSEQNLKESTFDNSNSCCLKQFLFIILVIAISISKLSYRDAVWLESTCLIGEYWSIELKAFALSRYPQRIMLKKTWCFQGISKEISGMKWVKKRVKKLKSCIKKLLKMNLKRRIKKLKILNEFLTEKVSVFSWPF